MTSRISARLLRLRRGYALLGRLVWACSPAWTVLGVVMSLLQACAAIGIMVGSGRLVQGLILGDLDGTWLAVTLVSLLVQPVAAAAIDVVGTIEQGRATPLLLERVAALASRPHGVEHLEDPEARQTIDATIEEINQQYFLGVQSAW